MSKVNIGGGVEVNFNPSRSAQPIGTPTNGVPVQPKVTNLNPAKSLPVPVPPWSDKPEIGTPAKSTGTK